MSILFTKFKCKRLRYLIVTSILVPVLPCCFAVVFLSNSFSAMKSLFHFSRASIFCPLWETNPRPYMSWVRQTNQAHPACPCFHNNATWNGSTSECLCTNNLDAASAIVNTHAPPITTWNGTQTHNIPLIDVNDKDNCCRSQPNHLTMMDRNRSGLILTRLTGWMRKCTSDAATHHCCFKCFFFISQ